MVGGGGLARFFGAFFTPSKGLHTTLPRAISTTQLYFISVKGFYYVFLTLLWKPMARVGRFLRNFNETTSPVYTRT